MAKQAAVLSIPVIFPGRQGESEGDFRFAWPIKAAREESPCFRGTVADRPLFHGSKGVNIDGRIEDFLSNSSAGAQFREAPFDDVPCFFLRELTFTSGKTGVLPLDGFEIPFGACFDPATEFALKNDVFRGVNGKKQRQKHGATGKNATEKSSECRAGRLHESRD